MDLSSSHSSKWFNSKSKREDLTLQHALKERCKLPQHIAVIMDGNGRWAQKHGKSRIEGHIAGVDAVQDIVECCVQLGIPYLTLFTFSTENWKRPEKEVTALMRLLIKVLQREARKINDNNIRLLVIGNADQLPPKVAQTVRETVETTKNNTGLTLVLALSYSGKWDIVQACHRIAEDVSKGNLEPEAVTEELMETYLATSSIPDPELLIRTSGEYRISNFLLWQSAYSEIFFTDVYWPDFRRARLYEAIEDFNRRERRFGLTSDQLKQTK